MSIESYFLKFKTKLELDKSYQETVTQHHNAIRDYIQSIDSSVETKLIGSLQRKTRIKPQSNKKLFDIDILVVLGSFFNWVSSGGITANMALNNVRKTIENNRVYDKLNPATDSPTITFTYKDNIKVELVPAYKDCVGRWPNSTPCLPVNRGYWIPKNNRWIIADYDMDADYISDLPPI